MYIKDIDIKLFQFDSVKKALESQLDKIFFPDNSITNG